MKPEQQAALHALAHSVRHHLHMRQVAEGQGLIPPLGQPQQAQPQPGAPAPMQPPAPNMQGSPQPPMPQPPMQSRQTLMSKAPPPLDPTQVTSVKNRPRNSLLYAGNGPGRPPGANAGRL